ncbi:MAG: prepilin peptidase [Acidobacteria bacterium]|nr:prepilin peptidase [Acidobacteriota bacterium]
MSNLPQLLALIPALYLVLMAIPLTVIDLREHRLPNRIVLPVFPIALLAQLAACLVGADWTHFVLAFGLAIIVFIAGVIANYFDWVGMGDVKLISAITLTLAFFDPMLSILAIGIAFVLAFLFVMLKIFKGKAELGQSIPLGPYLLISFIGSAIAHVWTSWA